MLFTERSYSFCIHMSFEFLILVRDLFQPLLGFSFLGGRIPTNHMNCLLWIELKLVYVLLKINKDFYLLINIFDTQKQIQLTAKPTVATRKKKKLKENILTLAFTRVWQISEVNIHDNAFFIYVIVRTRKNASALPGVCDSVLNH